MTATATKELTMAIKHLRDLHALGRKIGDQLGGVGHRPRYGSNRIGEIADEHGLPVQAARNAALFADRYSSAELKALCDDCRRRGTALTFAHVVRLLAVEPKLKRESIQRAAIRGNWTVARLNIELRDRGATPNYRGRLDDGVESAGYVRGKVPRAVRNIMELNGQISLDAGRWRRVWEFLKRQAGLEPADRPATTREFLSSKDLDRSLLKRLNELVQCFDKLESRAASKPDA